jgi:hypothetical protein
MIEYRYVGAIIEISIAAISLCCSILTIWVIVLLNKWNGYVYMIANLSIAQALYDISIMIYPCDQADCILSRNILRFSTGIAATLWTNIILFVVAYIVFYLKTIDVREYSFRLLFAVTLFSIAVAMIEQWQKEWRVYFWLRVFSILFNIILYLLVKRWLHLMTKDTTREISWSSWLYRLLTCQGKAKHKKSPQDPVRILAYRLKYYPIVQLITRLGVAWYEYISNTDGFDYDYDPNKAIGYQIAYFVYIVTQPSAGIGFFIIFMLVSPGAYRTMREYFLSMICMGEQDTAATTADGDDLHQPLNSVDIEYDPLYGIRDSLISASRSFVGKSTSRSSYGDDDPMNVMITPELHHYVDLRVFDDAELSVMIDKIYHAKKSSSSSFTVVAINQVDADGVENPNMNTTLSERGDS